MNESNKFIKIIEKNGSFGVSEPWCDNKAVVILPYIYDKNDRYFLLLKNELSNLFGDLPHKQYTAITGGFDNKDDFYKNVERELLEETGIDVKEENIYIESYPSYYANKTNIKSWIPCSIDLTPIKDKINFSKDKVYFGKGDGTKFEKGIHAVFVPEENIWETNDFMALAIYGMMNIFENKKIKTKSNE